jgi:hypothetical protein
MKRPNSARHESPIGIAFTGERIQDHVHTAPVGQFQHRLGEVAAARIDDVLHPESLEERSFGRAAGARDHFRAEMVRDLYRGHADTTRTRVNQNALSFAHPCDVLKRMP